jgi:hypothetical protein
MEEWDLKDTRVRDEVSRRRRMTSTLALVRAGNKTSGSYAGSWLRTDGSAPQRSDGDTTQSRHLADEP